MCDEHDVPHDSVTVNQFPVPCHELLGYSYPAGELLIGALCPPRVIVGPEKLIVAHDYHNL